ncbi:2-hydroxyacid dehydrogenase [Sagittula sp. SSi028]|uniref:2-hydroxyacid dehydrogenase n=1 Tax=Sagittula sp. SSi028 TaxID=3400636 RepID=UPI003AF8E4F9
MTEQALTGVATCATVDLLGYYGDAFAELAPDLVLLRPEEVTDPAAVSFVFTFVPDDDTFAPYPNLRAIFSAGAGTDAIMACPSRPDHVPVYRVEDPDQALQMAGFAAFHVVWHHRRMGQYLDDQAQQAWNPRNHRMSPASKRVGVMGFGLMGREVARSLVTLGYDVAGYSRRLPEPLEDGVEAFTDGGLDHFLARSDILINVLPLTPQTEGILNADTFAKLPKGAALIHIGRGGHLVEQDLIAALDSGHLSGASLDVFDTEPLPAGHAFWSHPQIFVTPHVASASEDRAVVASIVDQLRTLASA